jgi:hypothetical protein
LHEERVYEATRCVLSCPLASALSGPHLFGLGFAAQKDESLITLPLLGPNILVSNLLSNILNLGPSFSL